MASSVQPTFRQVRYEPLDPESRDHKKPIIKRGPSDPLKTAATPLYLQRLKEYMERHGEDRYIRETYGGESRAQAWLDNNGAIFMVALFAFIVFWVVVGVWAFVMSLICFGRSGSTAEKVIGLLLAWITGPFFWIYFVYNKGYCNQDA